MTQTMVSEHTTTMTIRLEPDDLELLTWWAGFQTRPLRSMVRAALEDLVADIVDAHHAGIDPRLPEGVLLKRLAERLEVRREHDHDDLPPDT